MDDITKLYRRLTLIFLADKGPTTTSLAINYLDELREELLKCEKFPSLKEVKRELDLYL